MEAKDWPHVRKTIAKPELLQDWTDAEWATFRAELKKQADAFWDDRFCLGDQSVYDTLDCRPRRQLLRANIDCRFEVIWAPSPPSSHQVVNCFRVRPGQEISGFACGSDDGDGVSQF